MFIVFICSQFVILPRVINFSSIIIINKTIKHNVTVFKITIHVKFLLFYLMVIVSKMMVLLVIVHFYVVSYSYKQLISVYYIQVNML